MRTQATILGDFPSAARKSPFKRRKISSTMDATFPASFAATAFNDPIAMKATIPATPAGRLVCTSCHRALNARPGCVISCARCTSTLCPVCSRTCTAPPPSMPPTPHLTYSPTPTHTPSESPRRTALGLASLNGDRFNGNKIVGKRRKFCDEEGNDEADEVEKDAPVKGCGRTVCKECCEESWQSGSTTCIDCYDRI